MEQSDTPGKVRSSKQLSMAPERAPCRYAAQLGLPQHACRFGECDYDKDEVDSRIAGAITVERKRYDDLRNLAFDALAAWDNTVLPKARDGMMQERMENLRAALTEGSAAFECEEDVVADMRSRANAYGLWAEVKDAYDGYRKNGEAPNKAAWCALYDWDL